MCGKRTGCARDENLGFAVIGPNDFEVVGRASLRKDDVTTLDEAAPPRWVVPGDAIQ